MHGGSPPAVVRESRAEDTPRRTGRGGTPMAASDAKREGMRVCWPEHGRAELAPFSVPDPKPGEVLVRSVMTLISPGTERAFFLCLLYGHSRFPCYTGYSKMGRVIVLGVSGERASGG